MILTTREYIICSGNGSMDRATESLVKRWGDS